MYTRVLPRRFAVDRNRLIDLIFEKGIKLTEKIAELARRAGLSYQTVYNLVHRITRFPQLMTLQKLAEAVGLQLMIMEVRSPTQRSEDAIAGRIGPTKKRRKMRIAR